MELVSQALRQAHADHSRRFGDFRHVYPVISRRAGGFSLGVNLNADKVCNFDCPYCSVDRTTPGFAGEVELERLAAELDFFLDRYGSGEWRSTPFFPQLPLHHQELRDISLSGDGEPTTSALFPEVVKLLVDRQASQTSLRYALVLITNATLLDRPRVLEAASALCGHKGEVWGKLDAGSPEWHQRMSRSRIPLERIQQNLELAAGRLPLRIQSMFLALQGERPSLLEQELWMGRIERLQAAADGKLLGVQLYTLARPPAEGWCSPVPMDWLADLAKRLESRCALPTAIYGS